MSPRFFLKNLIIQNFATFKNQSINFRPGFNAIVGETGSGKSLVLEALQLLLGGRADKKVVRRDADFSLVEATFSCDDPKIRSFLEEEGYPLEGSELIIKRLIYKNGTSKAYVNHLSCPVSFLSHFSRRYIDLVGQFENQKLLSESYQLHLLDHFCKLRPDLEDFQKLFQEHKGLKEKENALEESKTFRAQRLDYLNYQLQEIDSLDPSSQDEQDLFAKKSLMMNLEKIQKLCFQIKDIFEGGQDQNGLTSQIHFLSSIFIKHSDLFEKQSPLLFDIQDRAAQLLDEIEGKLNLEFDPLELEQVLDRLDGYQKLKKKFGGTVESVLKARQDFLLEKAQLEELEINLGDLSTKLETLNQKLFSLADSLHQKRKNGAKALAHDLTQKVRALKMKGATFDLHLEKSLEMNETGLTKVSFLAETNPGEGLFKIKDIASGGELSRILLSVRQILSSCDSISIFLFDEIDTGIGGETANSIGKALAEVSAHGQVIAITHLPQIAQFADALIVVHKDVLQKNNEARTESLVKEVVGKMILKEVKTMAQLS